MEYYYNKNQADSQFSLHYNIWEYTNYDKLKITKILKK